MSATLFQRWWKSAKVPNLAGHGWAGFLWKRGIPCYAQEFEWGKWAPLLSDTPMDHIETLYICMYCFFWEAQRNDRSCRTRFTDTCAYKIDLPTYPILKKKPVGRTIRAKHRKKSWTCTNYYIYQLYTLICLHIHDSARLYMHTITYCNYPTQLRTINIRTLCSIASWCSRPIIMG